MYSKEYPRNILDISKEHLYIPRMLRTVIFDRQSGRGRYRDIVMVAERLGKPEGEFSSATFAVAQMVRQSPLFQDEMAKIKAEAKRRPRRKRGAP